jgi:hypothetical protein
MTQGLNKIRRQLLITLASIPTAGWLKTTWSATDQDFALASKLTCVLKDRSSAQMIGMLYLKTTPDETNIKQLLSRIRHTDPELEIHAQNNHTALYKRIKYLQCKDFCEEHVVNIDGWILSQTEARLCALTTFI